MFYSIKHKDINWLDVIRSVLWCVISITLSSLYLCICVCVCVQNKWLQKFFLLYYIANSLAEKYLSFIEHEYLIFIDICIMNQSWFIPVMIDIFHIWYTNVGDLHVSKQPCSGDICWLFQTSLLMHTFCFRFPELFAYISQNSNENTYYADHIFGKDK